MASLVGNVRVISLFTAKCGVTSARFKQTKWKWHCPVGPDFESSVSLLVDSVIESVQRFKLGRQVLDSTF